MHLGALGKWGCLLALVATAWVAPTYLPVVLNLCESGDEVCTYESRFTK